MSEKRKQRKIRLFGNTRPRSEQRLAGRPQPSKKPAAGGPGFSVWVLPLAILFDELVFKWSTTVRPFGFNVFIIAVYSAVLGLLLWLPTSFIRSPSWNRRVKRIILLVVALLFCIEYFIYRQFKVFYDLNTIFNGAGHMLRGFLKQTIALVFSPQGIAHILLFFLPFLLYTIFGRFVDPVRPLKVSARLIPAIAAVLLFVLHLVIIYTFPVYTSTYSARTMDTPKGGDPAKFDFNDTPTKQNAFGYGCLQVHDLARKATVLAYNHFNTASRPCDVGIGSNPDPRGNPDWTFASNAGNYAARRISVWVK